MKKYNVYFLMLAMMSLFVLSCSELPTDPDEGTEMYNETNLALPGDGDGGEDPDMGGEAEDLGNVSLFDDDEYYDTGVPDKYVDDETTITDLLYDCAETARNHGQYVSCVSHVTNDLKKKGLLTGKEKGAIVRIAAQSDIGK